MTGYTMFHSDYADEGWTIQCHCGIWQRRRASTTTSATQAWRWHVLHGPHPSNQSSR